MTDQTRIRRVLRELQRDLLWVEKQDGRDVEGIACATLRMGDNVLELDELMKELRSEMPPHVAKAFATIKSTAMAVALRNMAFLDRLDEIFDQRRQNGG